MTSTTSCLSDDPGVRLLGIQLSAKRTEQAALRSLGDALAGPSTLVPHFYRSWTAAKAAEWNVHREIRRSCRRVVIPMIRRVVA